MHYNTLDASENVEIPLNDVRIEIYHRNNFKNFRSIFILTKYNWKDLVLFMFKDHDILSDIFLNNTTDFILITS